MLSCSSVALHCHDTLDGTMLYISYVYYDISPMNKILSNIWTALFNLNLKLVSVNWKFINAHSIGRSRHTILKALSPRRVQHILTSFRSLTITFTASNIEDQKVNKWRWKTFYWLWMCGNNPFGFQVVLLHQTDTKKCIYLFMYCCCW